MLLSQEHVLYEFQDEIPRHIFNKTAETITFFYAFLLGLIDIFFYCIFVDPLWDVLPKIQILPIYYWTHYWGRLYCKS